MATLKWSSQLDVIIEHLHLPTNIVLINVSDPLMFAGFQIIALTAHAEGKFLQDYFPIIYSCRLRASADPMKKIMTKEKCLHHAYFQDHEPVAMERLEELEQMELF